MKHSQSFNFFKFYRSIYKPLILYTVIAHVSPLNQLMFYWTCPGFSPTREDPRNEIDCMHRLIRINRIKHLPDRKTLLLLINAFVFCKLLYCSTVWSNTSKTNLKRLQLVQNFAGRIVLGLPKYDHISEVLKSLYMASYS